MDSTKPMTLEEYLEEVEETARLVRAAVLSLEEQKKLELEEMVKNQTNPKLH